MISVLISLMLALRGILRSRAALHLEVLALRHQLQAALALSRSGDIERTTALVDELNRSLPR
jgi:hypothetical protein